jgi:hypothetical protein
MKASVRYNISGLTVETERPERRKSRSAEFPVSEAVTLFPPAANGTSGDSSTSINIAKTFVHVSD